MHVNMVIIGAVKRTKVLKLTAWKFAHPEEAATTHMMKRQLFSWASDSAASSGI